MVLCTDSKNVVITKFQVVALAKVSFTVCKLKFIQFICTSYGMKVLVKCNMVVPKTCLEFQGQYCSHDVKTHIRK